MITEIVIFAIAQGTRASTVLYKTFFNTVSIPITLKVKVVRVMARLNIENRARAKGMIESGLSHREVSRAMNVHHTTKSRFWQKYQQTGTLKSKTNVIFISY